MSDRLLKYLNDYNFRGTDRNKMKGDTQLFGITHKMFTSEIGPTVLTEKNPELYKLLVEYGRYLDPNFRFTKITLNKNNQCPPHRDSKNRGITMICSLGDYKGGLLCLEDGREIDLSDGKPFYFRGSEITHWVSDFTGTRWTIVYYNGLLLEEKRPGTTDDKVFTELFKKREYTKYFGQCRGEVWADIGANVGAFTLRNGINAIETHSFEPDIDNYNILVKNAVNPENCHNVAVVPDGSASSCTLYLSKSEWNHTTARPVRGRKGVTVPAIGFRDAIHGCNCLKMDIEGGELEILDNCDLGGLDKMIIAYHINYDHSLANLNRRLDRIRSFGYSVQTTKYPEKERLDFFPNEIMIYCRRRIKPKIRRLA